MGGGGVDKIKKNENIKENIKSNLKTLNCPNFEEKIIIKNNKSEKETNINKIMKLK